MTTLMQKMRAAKATLDNERALSVEKRLDRIRKRYNQACKLAGYVPEKCAWASRQSDLAEMEIRLVTADGPDETIDRDLARLYLNDDADEGPAFTASLDEARNFVWANLPGFFVSSGLCALTGHASLGPDYNGPEGERLREEWPMADSYGVWDEDLAPGDGTHRECYAILACAVRVLAHRHEATKP